MYRGFKQVRCSRWSFRIGKQRSHYRAMISSNYIKLYAFPCLQRNHTEDAWSWPMSNYNCAFVSTRHIGVRRTISKSIAVVYCRRPLARLAIVEWHKVIKLKLSHLLLYVVYMCQKSYSFVDLFICYTQKCEVVSFNKKLILSHSIACSLLYVKPIIWGRNPKFTTKYAGFALRSRVFRFVSLHFLLDESFHLLQECPTGVVKEDTFKDIYAHFFPQGGLLITVCCSVQC